MDLFAVTQEDEWNACPYNAKPEANHEDDQTLRSTRFLGNRQSELGSNPSIARSDPSPLASKSRIVNTVSPCQCSTSVIADRTTSHNLSSVLCLIIPLFAIYSHSYSMTTFHYYRSRTVLGHGDRTFPDFLFCASNFRIFLRATSHLISGRNCVSHFQNYSPNVTHDSPKHFSKIIVQPLHTKNNNTTRYSPKHPINKTPIDQLLQTLFLQRFYSCFIFILQTANFRDFHYLP
jgi:hypothetical protein